LLLGIKLVALIVSGQAGSMLTYFSIPDFIRLGLALIISSALMIVPRLAGYPTFTPPRRVLLVDLLCSTACFCTFRMALRLYRERIMMGKKFGGRRAEKIAIVGVGDAGASLAHDLLNTSGRGLNPVVFLDDDESKHGKLVHDVRVAGPAKMVIACSTGFEIENQSGTRGPRSMSERHAGEQRPYDTGSRFV